MPETFQRTITNELHELEALMNACTNFLEDQGICAQAVYRINLALEEMVTNIIKHGYDNYDSHEISVTVDVLESEIVARIEDDGHAFDPLAWEAQQETTPLEERKVGGVGIHLIRQMLDEVEYQREGEKNILVVKTRREFPADTV